MLSTMIRAASAALITLALTLPAQADYVGAQAGGAGNITYGAFEATINGIKVQLTKSVPVDPVTGLALQLATSTKQPAFGTPGNPSNDVNSIQGVLNGRPVPTIGAQPTDIATGQVSCGTTAAQAVPARAGRRNVLLIQEGTTLVRVGAAGVTPSTGAPLPGTAFSAMTIDGGAAVYCITGSGTQSISYLETY